MASTEYRELSAIVRELLGNARSHSVRDGLTEMLHLIESLEVKRSSARSEADSLIEDRRRSGLDSERSFNDGWAAGFHEGYVRGVDNGIAAAYEGRKVGEGYDARGDVVAAHAGTHDPEEQVRDMRGDIPAQPAPSGEEVGRQAVPQRS